MSLRFSTGLRAGLLAVGSLKTLLAGSELRLYAGPVPASVDNAIGASNQVLCVIRNDGLTGLNFEDTAPDGLIAKKTTESWKGTNIASGTATFYRHVLMADTDTSSASEIRIQGTVGLAGADMNISNTALVTGAVQSLEAYTIALPEV